MKDSTKVMWFGIFLIFLVFTPFYFFSKDEPKRFKAADQAARQECARVGGTVFPDSGARWHCEKN